MRPRMAKNSRSKTFAEAAIARTLLGSLALLPRNARVAAGRSFARIARRFLKRLYSRGLKNLGFAYPNSDEAWRIRIMNGLFDHYGMMLGEAAGFDRLSKQDLANLIDLKVDEKPLGEYLKEKANGRGVLLVTGHLGNWEMLAFSIGAALEPIHFFARPIDNPIVEELVDKKRRAFGNVPVDKTNSVMRAMRVLKSGGMFGVLSDVNAHPKEGVFVDFFGIPASTHTGPALLAIRANAIIMPVFAIWNADGSKYIFEYAEAFEPSRTGDLEHDIQVTTQRYTAAIESVIRKYPDQWLWIHRRWKTRPPGEHELY